MASPSSAPASPLPRHQLLRSVPLSLGVALNRPAAAPPTIGPARVPRRVDAAARRGASSPKGGPGSPAQGGGGKVHSAPVAATAARVVMRRGPTPPAGRPAEGGGGKVHAAPAVAMAMARVVVRGPARPSTPAEGAGGRGGIVHAADS
ncbi:hypothetical protein C2845_PM13G04440 [Panicum miliaceum]|uniref:Uncharacterized protein n=1 Tax=Panicum miliaceum TaxID=4540 RepID=A0A3L6RIJ3_PANMI|nr:hypothetical protein C2845_PM13G04440 [Panicum miliaceum]